ncbi:MAG TPA: PIN domain-containing protein [Stellaceae bacterium]|nr:PIN domain-containing protein [Stellaceae bacterium]
MSDKAFFDTNVVLYAFAQDDPRMGSAELLLAAGGVISVQVLNEFCAVARRKLGMSWDEVLKGLAAIRALCRETVPITIDMHDAAVTIAQRYGYVIYEAQIIAAALKSGCAILYTEDMRHGQVIDGLTIRNPFGELAPKSAS